MTASIHVGNVFGGTLQFPEAAETQWSTDRSSRRPTCQTKWYTNTAITSRSQTNIVSIGRLLKRYCIKLKTLTAFFRPGSWLPADNRVHREWLGRTIDHIDEHGEKELIPVLREFKI
jgi:hypothetical protein